MEVALGFRFPEDLVATVLLFSVQTPQVPQFQSLRDGSDRRGRASRLHEALGTVFPKERIRKNEPMKNHTAFKIGGPADLMLLAVDADEVGRALRVLHEIGTPCFVMGNGSNLLVSDQGYRGVILKIGEGFDISIGTMAPPAQALFPLSGAAIPSRIPVPNFSGCLDARLASP